jgi:hypothetical protein
MCWTRAAVGRPVRVGMFLTGYFTLPISGGAFKASCVIDVGIAAMQLTVAQYQDATNVFGHHREN